MSEITEYQQVAALVCLDIDILAKVSKRKDMSLEDLQAVIQDIKEKKDKLTSDPKEREQRYSSACMLFNLGQ